MTAGSSNRPRDAIPRRDCGTRSTLMIGAKGRPWHERLNCNGGSCSELPHCESTW